ncbi:MAG: glutamate racemase [Flammeovirgaceae bacterium]|nr:MAG: glutamate racemase [Flammeovirgaceae bacterium]
MPVSANNPIGIFDSGIGGLTVAHAIKELLPNEQLIYFGDTAHLPYGDKSEAAIQAYSVRIADVLLKKDCKLIVIACNSASSAAYELLKEYVRGVKIINVIDPMVQWVASNFKNSNVGLIGTKRTVQSGVYLRKIDEANRGITLHQLATPLLAPMIEEGFFNNQISHEIIGQYLSAPELSEINALILACTHYPLIRNEIAAYYRGRSVIILDSSEVVALAVKEYLFSADLLNSRVHGADQFLVSDYTTSFEASTRLFFGQQVHLQENPLWH